MAKEQPCYLAVDLGASSGRVFACHVNDHSLNIDPIHRFENRPIRLGKTLYWNLPSLWENVLEGLRLAAKKYPAKAIRSVGVDSWGVDFAFLGPDNELLGLPIHYRDSHTEDILESAFKVVPKSEIYQKTGLQILNINSLFQLFALKNQKPTTLKNASRFLMIPDLFHWLLSGQCKNEITDTSTSQMINPADQTWQMDLVEKLGIPSGMLGEIIQPGTCIGPIVEEVQKVTGLSDQVQVVAPATHDTASAVAAIPNPNSSLSSHPNWCYISSGTWSLMGVEVDQPFIDQKTESLNFTNEIGINRSIRLLKNIAGLWLVQQCKAAWEKQGHSYSWDELIGLAKNCSAGEFLFDPDDASLAAPDDMPQAITALLEKQNGRAPNGNDHGKIIRACLDSLALRYRYVLGCLEEILGNRINKIYIVGGGSQNQLLCQITADVCQREVFAGPAEATVIGNALVQAFADGAVESLEDARSLVAERLPPVNYQPEKLPAEVMTLFQEANDQIF